MLRINQHSSQAAAKNYYQSMVKSSVASYYASEPEQAHQATDHFIGRVDGKLADRLNLVGGMTEQQFNDLIDGNAVDQHTGEPLRKRQNRDGNNRVGLDLTFDPGGKSLSTYYAGTRDSLIPKLFEEARHETMVNDVEPRMMVRVRQNGANFSKLTGNALWTSFPDLDTRPTKVKDENGKWVETFTVDPHIHDHNYIFQYTWDKDHKNRDGSQGAYLSADTSKIFSSMPYIQRAFHARLFKKLQDRGYNVEKTEHGIELKGWNDKLSKMFSRRTEEIEAWAEKRGIENPELKDRLGKLTRSGKAAGKLTREEQFDEWRDRLSDSEWDAFIVAARSANSDSPRAPKFTIDQAIEYGLQHTLERSSSATIEEVLMAAIDVGFGLDVEQLKSRLLQREDVVSAWFGSDQRVTTQAMSELEQSVLQRAGRYQASCLPLGDQGFEFESFDSGDGKRVDLNMDQQSNIRKLLSSTSRFMTLRGAPGVGKTAALGTQLFRAVEQNGGNVVTLGATSNARDELIKFGIESGSSSMKQAVTLARFLGDKEAQSELGPRSLVVLDESTLAGLRDLEPLTRIIEDKKARLLLVGDYRQMDAVQAHSKIFEQLCNIGGHAEFKEIVRQRDPDYRRAATLTSSGEQREVQAGFDKLVELGFVRQIDQRKDRIEQAARAYLDITSEKKSRRGKRLEWSDQQKQDPVNYRSGMTVIRGTGQATESFEVVGRDLGHVLIVPLHQAEASNEWLDLSKPTEFSVFEANYNDALLIVGTHREGEAITSKIRQLRKRHGELGVEFRLDRLESEGQSEAERKQAENYRPGEQIVEFARKAKTERSGNTKTAKSIGYGERFAISGWDQAGRVLMKDSQGTELVLPLQLAERFDVYRTKPAKLAVGDKIRMTKGGHTMPDASGAQGVRFSNNDVFTVAGLDSDGNPVLNNGHRLAKDWQHWRSGYYKTSMAGQGSTSSHNIFVDSVQAGRARSKESWLVSITRGKNAATILTDDIQSLRNHAIIRTAQSPSAIEVQIRSGLEGRAAAKEEESRMLEQKKRLRLIDEFAQLADTTWQIVRRNGQQLFDKARHVLPPSSRRIEEPAS